MTRSAYAQWVEAVGRIIGMTAIVNTRDLELMWSARLTPVEAAAAICVDQFEQEINR